MEAIATFLAKKFVAPVAIAATVVLLALLAWKQIQLVDARSDLSALQTRYDDKLSDYTTAHNNVLTCQAAVADRNAKLAKQAADDSQRLASAQAALAAAQAKAKAADAKLAALMAYRPQGADVCARAEDVRQQILREYVQ